MTNEQSTIAQATQAPTPPLAEKKVSADSALSAVKQVEENKALTPEKQFARELKLMEKEIVRALPKHMDIGRFSRTTLSLIKQTPKLLVVLQQAPNTLWASILLSAQLGLDLTPGLGQGYIIPYYNKKTGKTEAQFQAGYRGLLDMVYRSGEVQSVQCEVSYEKDFLDIQFGTDFKFIHKPFLDGERGKAKLYYAVFTFKSGNYHVEWMTTDQVKRIRMRSKSPNEGPWVTDEEEMSKKTVIRRATKKLPMSTEYRRMIEQDETVKRNIAEDMLDAQEDEKDFIDTTSEVVEGEE